MEVDHIFICVAPDATEAENICDFGLTEGSSNQHQGQGTASRRFFFHNTFIELLYLNNAADAQTELSGPTKLHERLTSNTDLESPFGFCFRPSASSESSIDATAPFPSWQYQPQYLPSHLQVEIGVAPVDEPMWFFLNFATRPDAAALDKRQPIEHASGFKEITSVRVTLPKLNDFSHAAISDAAKCIEKYEIIEILRGDCHLLELGFDHALEGNSFDFRPALPLIFNW